METKNATEGKGGEKDTNCPELNGKVIQEIALARCDYLIDRYLKWKQDNHRKSDTAQRVALVFTAITPVLLLLPWRYVNILGAATSAVAAIATGFLAISGWRDQYIRYGYVWHKLQTEKFLCLTRSAKEYSCCNEETAARRFAVRIEQVVLDEVSEWRSLMQRLQEMLPNGGGSPSPSREQ